MEYRILKLNQLMQGWGDYFKIGAIINIVNKWTHTFEEGLRACRWNEWKKTRTKYRNFKKLGIKANEALKIYNSRKGYWTLQSMLP